MKPDPHSERAALEFGVLTPDTRARAKVMNYAELYGSGSIQTARHAGHYPLAAHVKDVTP